MWFLEANLKIFRLRRAPHEYLYILEYLRDAVSIKKLLYNYINLSDLSERASGFRGDSERENLYQFRMALFNES